MLHHPVLKILGKRLFFGTDIRDCVYIHTLYTLFYIHMFRI